MKEVLWCGGGNELHTQRDKDLGVCEVCKKNKKNLKNMESYLKGKN